MLSEVNSVNKYKKTEESSEVKGREKVKLVKSGRKIQKEGSKMEGSKL